jgi:hypothetical protein
MFEEGAGPKVAMWLCEARALIANTDLFFRLLFIRHWYEESIEKGR